MKDKLIKSATPPIVTVANVQYYQAYTYPVVFRADEAERASLRRWTTYAKPIGAQAKAAQKLLRTHWKVARNNKSES